VGRLVDGQTVCVAEIAVCDDVDVGPKQPGVCSGPAGSHRFSSLPSVR